MTQDREVIIAASVACIMLTISIISLTTSCVSLSDESRDDIADIISIIPSPTATPSPTPLPTATPKPADVSLLRIQRDLPEFAANKGLPTTNTSRGIMLDMRGRSDFDAVFSEWCQLTGGAALPALTDAEPRGVFHQCQ